MYNPNNKWHRMGIGVVLAVLLVAGGLDGCWGRVLSKCDAVKELSDSGISRSFLGHFYCVMKSSSQLDTSLKRGPGHKASHSYGVFQISSDRWCNAFRPGGECNKKCSDFLDDDIHDDIACAKLIVDLYGFKYWASWVKSCKLKPRPTCNLIDHCNIDAPEPLLQRSNASAAAAAALVRPLHRPAPLLGFAMGQFSQVAL